MYFLKYLIILFLAEYLIFCYNTFSALVVSGPHDPKYVFKESCEGTTVVFTNILFIISKIIFSHERLIFVTL
jgi:uncharacterized membrane protein YhdT